MVERPRLGTTPPPFRTAGDASIPNIPAAPTTCGNAGASEDPRRRRQAKQLIGGEAAHATPSSASWPADVRGLSGAEFAREAQNIRTAWQAPNSWSPFLSGHSSAADVAHLIGLAEQINPERAEEMVVRFFGAAARTLEARSPAVARHVAALPENWHKDPLYYAYVQYFGTHEGADRATFDQLIERLDHLEYLGIRNVFLLPHYESPGGDGGYDVSDYRPAEALGGEPAYKRFMEAAVARGFRVMTDIPGNHTSTRHKWFQALLRGDRTKLDYYIALDGMQVLTDKPVVINGQLRNVVKHPDDTISAIWVCFPFASEKSWIDIDVDGERHQLLHTFYPFQVDLNLANPEVLEEFFDLLGSEANLGNVGKRMDAAPYWFKKRGTDLENLRETHAVQALFKSFIRHVIPGKGVTLPEVGSTARDAAKYFGVPIEIKGVNTTSEGDALFAFEMQAALREMLFTGSVDAFWHTCDSLPPIPENAVWLNMLGHHDELRTDLISEPRRAAVRSLLMARGALDFAGRGLGGRTAPLLDDHPQRIATAFFALYMAPGTPVIYYGDEIGAGHDPEFMAAEQERRHVILNELGVDTPFERALDTRDLNRGPIPAKRFDEARAARALPLETLRALNHLRDSEPALRGNRIDRLQVGHEDVFALIRHADEARSLIALANLSGHARDLQMPRDQVERVTGPLAPQGELNDHLGSAREGAPKSLAYRLDGDTVRITIEPWTSVLLAAPKALCSDVDPCQLERRVRLESTLLARGVAFLPNVVPASPPTEVEVALQARRNKHRKHDQRFECRYLPLVLEGHDAFVARFAPLLRSGYLPDVTIEHINEAAGMGLFARSDIPPGGLIGEYTGIGRFVPDPSERRALLRDRSYVHTCCGTYATGDTFIDAEQHGNHTRFMNHSDEPNVASAHAFYDGTWHVAFIAKEPIKAGGQLFIDYGTSYWGPGGPPPELPRSLAEIAARRT